MENYKIIYNKLLERYNNGCEYIKSHPESKFINELLNIALQMEDMIKSYNINKNNILGGFKE